MIIKKYISSKLLLNIKEIKIKSLKYDTIKLYSSFDIKNKCQKLLENENTEEKKFKHLINYAEDNEINKKHFNKFFSIKNNLAYFFFIFRWLKYIIYLYLFFKFFKIYKYFDSVEFNNLSFKKIKKMYFPEKNIQTKFKDVIGIDEYKEDLEFVVEFLKNTKNNYPSGLNLPKGVLLYGPPGCGKTMLARAVAGESNVNFYYLCASELFNKYIGEGAKLLRNIFSEAKKNGPSIIFIDEIDALTNRDNVSISNDSNTLNQLLTLLDGFETNEKVVLIGATNDISNIDKALLRPGRFDIKIEIPLPFIESRKKLIEHYVNKIKSESIDIDDFSKKTIGFSPADIKNMVNIAIINAVKNDKSYANELDYKYALERIKLGILEKNKILNKEKVERLGLIEASKAIFLYKNDELKNEKTEKISLLHNFKDNSFIVKNDEKYSFSKTCFKEKIKYHLVPRIIENLLNLEHSNLSIDSFENSNNMLKDYIIKYGMMEEFLLLSLDSKEISKNLKNEIDIKIENTISDWSKEVEISLKPFLKKIIKFKDLIIKKEILDSKEIETFLKSNL